MAEPLTPEAFDRLPLGDALLTSVGWIGATDVELVLELPRSRPLRMACRWVAGLRVDLDFGKLSGPPLVSDAALRPVDGGGWHLLLDFAGAPTGTIELDCNEVELLAS
jgi:hypothetical protein